MTTVAYFGPIAIEWLGDFHPEENGDPNEYGQALRFSVRVKKPQAEQLKELVDNEARRFAPYGLRGGVLEPIWVQNRPELFGFYLLHRCSLSATPTQQLLDHKPFTLEATLLRREVVVTRSARARTNDFDLTARSLVVQPFWGEDPDGEPFVTDPGGTPFSRKYDPRTSYNPASPATTGRNLRLHAGTVT